MVFFRSNASFTRASKNAHVSRKSARKQATQVSGTVLTSIRPHRAIKNRSQPKMVIYSTQTPKLLQYPWEEAQTNKIRFIPNSDFSKLILILICIIYNHSEQSITFLKLKILDSEIMENRILLISLKHSQQKFDDQKKE
jgi:hypothetical protein